MRKTNLTSLLSAGFLCVFLTSLCAFSQTTSTQEAPKKEASSIEKDPSESFNNFDEAFQNGVSLYRAKDFAKAHKAFSQALNFDSRSPQALTNLALVQFQLGEKGWAIALLRKALSIDADLPTAQAALQFIIGQDPIKEIPHEIEIWESLRTHLLAPVSLSVYLGLTALFLLAAGWLVLRYLGNRKRALKMESSLPTFSFVTFLSLLGFIVFMALTFLKGWDARTPRGTIVVEKTSVQAAPSKDSPTLFELYSGIEVIVRSENNNWLQITYPGGQTGWIPKADLFLTSERGL